MQEVLIIFQPFPSLPMAYLYVLLVLFTFMFYFYVSEQNVISHQNDPCLVIRSFGDPMIRVLVHAVVTGTPTREDPHRAEARRYSQFLVGFLNILFQEKEIGL